MSACSRCRKYGDYGPNGLCPTCAREMIFGVSSPLRSSTEDREEAIAEAEIIDRENERRCKP